MKWLKQRVNCLSIAVSFPNRHFIPHSSSYLPSKPTQSDPSSPPTRMPPPQGFQLVSSRYHSSEIIVNSPRATRGDTEVTPPILFSETIITIIIKLALYHVFVLYKFGIIFPQILLHYQHTFPPLCETLYAGRVNILS